MNWRQRFLNPFSSRARNSEALPDGFSLASLGERGAVLKCNVSQLDYDEQAQFFHVVNERMGYEPFKGPVKYAWGASAVETTDLCPRCGAATKVYTANFIYLTQIEIRGMYSPAGHYCTSCPSVIIDEEMVQAGISDPRYEYLGVAGVDYFGEREEDYFQQWNGKERVHIVDGEGCIVGLDTIDDSARGLGGATARGARRKVKHKNREKAARRAKRAKKKR